MQKSKTEIQNEIVEILGPNPHGIADLSPRIGKTRIGIEVIKRDKPKKILWTTPNTDLRDTDIPKEFETWKAKTYLKKTKIVCWASLDNVTGHYPLIIMDEAQYITEANSAPLFDGRITYDNILVLTGTVPKGEDKVELLDRLGLSVIHRVSIDEAQEAGLVADYRIKVVLGVLDDTKKVIPAGNKAKPFMQTEKAAYDYINKKIQTMTFSGRPVPAFMFMQRMSFIKNTPTKELIAKTLFDTLPGRSLIFCSSIAQAERLCEHTHHSKKKDSDDFRRFIEGRLDKLACVDSGGVGSTYRGVDNFIVVQSNSNQNGSITQKIARALVAQEGYTANIYLIGLDGTVDMNWIKKSLEDFDSSKVLMESSRAYVK